MGIIIDSPKHGRIEVLVDRQDGERLKGKSLYVHKVGQFLYVRINPNKEYLHRYIMGTMPKGMVVDHINRNTLDNRRQNLRVVTIQENLRNQLRPNNKTGYTGVSIGHKGKYNAQIKHNYKKIHLGTFDTIKEALEARKQAEIEQGWLTPKR